MSKDNKAPAAVAQRGSVLNDKKDNITSKLLGTNVNEINIEKFREIKYQPPPYQLAGKLNEQILKTITSKFSTELIFVLDLSAQQLTDIEALELCPHLTMLNLKNNNVKDLFPLREMKEMIHLNVSHNSIVFLEPLKQMSKLTNLHAEQNQLKSFKNLKGLEALSSLRTLFLQNISGSTKNSVCEEGGYRETVFNMCPSLQRLDGIPKSVVLDNGESLLKKTKEFKGNVDLSSGSNSYWYTKTFPKVEPLKEVKIEGEEDLKNSLKDCKNLISSLEAKMKALMTQ